MELALIVVLENDKTIERSTHPFLVSVDDTGFVEIFKAFRNILQLRL